MSQITRFFAAGLAFSLLGALVPAVMAAEEVLTEQQQQDRTECMASLGYTEEQVKLGTFLYRLRSCMNDKEAGRFAQVANQRQLMREAAVRERLLRTGRSKATVLNSQSGYRYLEQNQNIQQRNVTGVANRIRRVVEIRSRRQLVKELEKPVGVAREEQSETYQTLRRAAYDACRQHTNSFARNNCIREQLRDLGAQ